jgi:hypothetical protein
MHVYVMYAMAVVLVLAAGVAGTQPQDRGINLDESKVPPYKLPNVLVCVDGTKVATPKIWREKRRPELLALFTENMYGKSPERPAEVKFEVTSVDAHALKDVATRKEITVWLNGQKDGPQLHILLYVPNASKKPVPAFVGVDFEGNHTVWADPGITIFPEWRWDAKAKTESLVVPDEKTRGNSAGRWAVDRILARGFALAVISRADIEPDYPDGWKHGIRGYYLKQSGKREFAADDWGAIAAWAWGTSRTLDYLEKDKDVDAKRVVVMGHSRLGKAALWAGASDERFAAVISNESGEGGAAIARRWYGETTAVINDHFPHWFCGNFKKYSNHEDAMPTDQHELLALIAPRLLYVASAEEDQWSDPTGEFEAVKKADPVWRLLGGEGLNPEDAPMLNHPVGAMLRYHIRPGKHDVTDYDWQQYLEWASLRLNPGWGK